MLKCPLCTLGNLVFFLKHYPAKYLSPFQRKTNLQEILNFLTSKANPFVKIQIFQLC